MQSNTATNMTIADLFDQFIDASTMKEVLSLHQTILSYSQLSPCEFSIFYPKFKNSIASSRERKNWRANAIFSKIDKKANHRCYSNTKLNAHVISNSDQKTDNVNNNFLSNIDLSTNSSCLHTNNNALHNHNCLIIGGGPAGLRTAIELQLLGSKKVVLVEKRGRFSRNNVVHLWPFVIDDLKSLGAKKFYGKFCAGSIDHISIRQLQLTLLKTALILGCDFRDSCSFSHICPSSIKPGDPSATNESTLSDSDQAILINPDCDSYDKQYPLIICEYELSQQARNERVEKILDNDGIITKELSGEEPTSNNENVTSFVKNNNDFNVGNEENNSGSGNFSLDRKSENIHSNVDDISFTKSLSAPYKQHGAKVHFESEFDFKDKQLHCQEWDIIIGADGRRNTLKRFFPRKEFRGRLAIAITANFINRGTPAEAAVPEISGLSYIYNQGMFNALSLDTGIDLENVCYYKDDTHYFVMTAKKRSLLDRGVLLKDYSNTIELLNSDNVNKDALLKFARDAAHWTTKLEPLDFALNHYGLEDCAMFDFTSMYAAINASKVVKTKGGGLTLFGLVGDSLLEPFWPTGSGCARGFLSSLDAAWMCRQWAVNRCSYITNDFHHKNKSSKVKSNIPLNQIMAMSVIAERESIYRILGQTKSENLQQNYSHWTLNPHTRYPNLNRHLVSSSQVEHLMLDENLRFIVKGSRAHQTGRLKKEKSPSASNHTASARKSPKKLKSANTSPSPGSRTHYYRSIVKARYISKSRPDLGIYDREGFYDLEEYPDNLTEKRSRRNRYFDHSKTNDLCSNEFLDNQTNYKHATNELYEEEMARRVRDIDDCIRLRRQRSQLKAVKNQLIEQFDKNQSSEKSILKETSFLSKELKKLRQQRSMGKENINENPMKPILLLNSIRRCASFAERVKSFEEKKDIVNSDKNLEKEFTRPIVHNVKNLPQFATFQRLFSSKQRETSDDNLVQDKTNVRSKFPIAKLTKEDWNVRCWEERLTAYRQASGSSTNYNSLKINTSDSKSKTRTLVRSGKSVEVFQDRIREMASKLHKSNSLCESNKDTSKIKNNKITHSSTNPKIESTRGSWVSHLRQELINSSQPSVNSWRSSNLKPVKKLFENEEKTEPQDPNNIDELDPDQHYDHLCINKSKMKHQPRNAYKSHLSRIRFDKDKSIVLDRNKVLAKANIQNHENQLSQIPSLALRRSLDCDSKTLPKSATSFIIDRQVKTNKPCSRCNLIISRTSDAINVSTGLFHRNCLNCSECSLTLRTCEIEHYMGLVNYQKADDGGQIADFKCTICKPEIRFGLSSRKGLYSNTDDEKRVSNEQDSDINNSSYSHMNNKLRPSDNFLNERIDYNEIYKNIVDIDKANEPIHKLSSRSQNIVTLTSSSSIDITLPIKSKSRSILKSNSMGGSGTINNRLNSSKFNVARSESIDGTESVTLILPDDNSKNQNLDGKLAIEDQNIHGIHCQQIDNQQNFDDSSSSSDNQEQDNDGEAISSEARSKSEPTSDIILCSDDSSSLNSTLHSFSGSEDSEFEPDCESQFKQEENIDREPKKDLD